MKTIFGGDTSPDFVDGLLDSLSTGVVVVGLQGRIQFLSAPAARILQVDEPSTLEGTVYTEFFAAGPIADCLARGERKRVRNEEIRRPGGPVRVCDYTVAPLRVDGSHQGVVVELHPPSGGAAAVERPVAVELASPQRVLLDDVRDGILLLDGDWRLVWLNSSAEAWASGSRAELIGRDFWEVFPELVGTDIESRYRAVMAGEGTIEFEVAAPEQSMWSAIRVQRAGEGLSIDFRDVTEVREVRLALERSVDDQRLLTSAIPQQVWTAGPNGALDYVSKRALDYFGPHHDILGDGWHGVLHPADLERVVERWTHSLNTGELYEVEFRLLRHDGVHRWHLGLAAAQCDADGTILKWFGTNTDIHEKRTAEAARDELMKVVSHDLRGPLQAVLLGARLLSMPGLDDDGRSRGVEAILEASTAMIRLVEDLTDVGRMEEGQLVVERELVSVAELFRQTTDVFGLVAADAGVGLSCEGADSLQVMVDPHRMGQVLFNLVGNALRHTPRGGSIVLRAWQDAAGVVIQVRDSGPGVPDGMSGQVFQRFWRKDSEGLGLGLAIARGIVTSHQGDIRVFNEGGAVFHISLPLAN